MNPSNEEARDMRFWAFALRLLRAQQRMLTRWSEGDEAVKQQLWRDLHERGEEFLVEAAALSRRVRPEGAPIDMILFCPKCGLKHVDEPEPGFSQAGGVHPVEPEDAVGWDNPPHRSHLCHGCGCIWRPADVPTNGVAALATIGKADTIDLNKIAALGSQDRPAPDAELVKALKDDAQTLTFFANGIEAQEGGISGRAHEARIVARNIRRAIKALASRAQDGGALVRAALEAMLDHYGPAGSARDVEFPAEHPITLARQALAASPSALSGEGVE